MKQKSTEKEIKVNFLRSNVAKKYMNLTFKALITKIKNNFEYFKLKHHSFDYTYILDLRSNDEFIILENPIVIRDLLGEKLNGNNK